jgi:GNAT superfamily N-acetyltransferase
MLTRAELIAASDRSYIGSYRKLAEHAVGGETFEVGSVFAFVTGAPIPLFNSCLALQPAEPADLANAVAWLEEQHLPYRVWIAEGVESDLREIPLAFGLERDEWSVPGMFSVTRRLLRRRRPESRSRRSWPPICRPLGLLVGDGKPSDLTHRLFPASFAADPDVTLLTAGLDGRPVGTSIAIRTGDVSGVYTVSVRPDASRRGVGTAASWAAVERGRERGCSVIALQSTKMGYPVYTRMGFQTVVRYAVFNEPPAGQIDPLPAITCCDVPGA